MARPLRLELPGSWYHPTTRGNEQKAIFRQDLDRLHFLALREEAVERFVLRLPSYAVVAGAELHGVVQSAARAGGIF